MDELDDAELINRWQLYGDLKARNEVVLRYKELIGWMAFKNVNTNVTQEDLYQEGVIIAYTAIDNYKADSGAVFKTFLTICLRRGIFLVKFNQYRGVVHPNKGNNHLIIYQKLSAVLGNGLRLDRISHKDVENAAEQLGVNVSEVIEALSLKGSINLHITDDEGNSVDMTEVYNHTSEKEDPSNIVEFEELLDKVTEKIKMSYPMVAEGIIYKLLGITPNDDSAIIKKLAARAGVSNTWFKFLIAKAIKEIKEEYAQ